MFANGGDWRSKSLALSLMFSTTLNGFYFANCVLCVFFITNFKLTTMKTIRELRDVMDFYPNELSSQLKYFTRQNIDWNVYLPTKGKNLQRDFVWSLEQKRELINSMLIGRHIPHCAIVNIVDPNNDHKDILQVIDGKQRLSAMVDFYENKFTIELEGNEYYFKDLPNDYQLAISHYHFRYYVVNEPYGSPMTDEQKINWFKFINFAGTPQDAEHLRGLS
jgi:hypothetical protein